MLRHVIIYIHRYIDIYIATNNNDYDHPYILCNMFQKISRCYTTNSRYITIHGCINAKFIGQTEPTVSG